ncbi:uncharacterized protein LOC130796717 [Amaranthus tricolor]|uniref:uncharacterized protein LOC130796717 n=1 Tax=Amaranthus tricolor TaxID=29722 RepID=UPI0025897761|nr:uncharacterized protein LOC130796717 [Amaranthus tricolor]
MNDQSQMMNQHPMMNQPQLVSQQPPQMPPPPTHAQINQLNQMVANQVQVQAQDQMVANYGQWSQPPHTMPPPMKPMQFANPMNQMLYAGGIAKSGRSGNWKGKKPMDKRKDGRRKDNSNNSNNNKGMSVVGGPVGGLSYQPPTLYELEQQNRLKARRFYHPKRKFNRMGPYAHAPRNTTSYIIRAKKSGGIASLVSPCPVTPAVLPTPVFSPSRESLVDMAKEEWGVDGYGSMKGLIRLRSPGHDEAVDDYDEEDDGGSSESDVEEHVEVERRLDHDLSRFEMIYPNSGVDYHNVLENRVDDQDTHIAQLEEENLILKERLYLMERELGELRRRLCCLERQNQVVEDVNEEIVENVSENDSEGLRSVSLLVNKHNEEVDFVPRNGAGDSEALRDDSGETLHKELKELAVKDDIHCEGMKFHETDVGLEEDKQDIGSVGNVLGHRLPEDKQIGTHEKEVLMDMGNESSAHQEPVNDNILRSFVENKTDNNIDVAGTIQVVEDACMGEALLDEMNENNRSKGEVTDRNEVNLKQNEAVVVDAIGRIDEVNNIDAAKDVPMGDVTTDKEVNSNDRRV